VLLGLKVTGVDFGTLLKQFITGLDDNSLRMALRGQMEWRRLNNAGNATDDTFTEEQVIEFLQRAERMSEDSSANQG
jgi:hypothetical protein